MTASITSDKARDDLNGANMEQRQVQVVRPRIGPIPSAVSLPVDKFEGMVLIMAFTDGIRHQALGSAVMAAPEIALTAFHIVEDHVTSIREGTMSVTAHCAPTAASIDMAGASSPWFVSIYAPQRR